MTRSRLCLLALLAAASLLWWAGPAARLALVCALLMFAPGFLITRFLPGPDLEGPFVRPAVWLGLSISAVALLYEAVTFAGGALSTSALAALALACGVGAAAVLWRDDAWPRPAGHHYALAATLLATLGLRLYQIRTLALPAWVDSVHHALMIRVALERGQAPINLTPYLPITELPYHWGYHVFAAASAQLAGVTVPQVMLWQGQALNTLHVLACAALASALWRKPWAGVAAGVVVGCVSFMPAFYVSWGRYTQLTGLLLLPPLAICWRAMLQTGRARHAITSALLLAGLSLVHFRILMFALSLVFAISLIWMLDAEKHELRRSLVLSAATACASLLITGPWLYLLFRHRLAPIAEAPQSFFNGGSYGILNDGLLWAGPNRLLVGLALLGACAGIARRAPAALLCGVWVGMMVVMANPALLLTIAPLAGAALLIQAAVRRHVPLALFGLALLAANPWTLTFSSSWLITNDVMAISLFVPLAVLIGGFIESVGMHVCELLSQRFPGAGSWASAAGSIILALIGLWGISQQRDIINPSTILATGSDLQAIEWIAAHTPADARFLVGAAPWMTTAARGTDGGWWIMPLTGRWTSTPPVLFDYGPATYVQLTRQMTQQIVTYRTGNSSLLWDIIQRQSISYVYIKDGAGTLSAKDFRDTSRFTQVYKSGDIAIFAIRQ